MPNRIIKESICTSENIDRLTPFQETVFVRLMVNCDDYGRFDARPKLLVSRLFPLRDIPIEEMEEAVQVLQEADLITVYTVDGHPYLFMNKWLNHQQKRSDKSKYPSPDESNCNQMQSDDITCNQMESDETKSPRNRNRDRNTLLDNRESLSSSEPLIADDDAKQIQNDHNRVLDAAEDAGFKMSNDVRGSLIALYAQYGLEKVLDGLKSCSEHGASNLAYLRAVLKGEPKKQTGKVLPAQNFQQRDYSEVDKQIQEAQRKRIIEMICRNNGLWDEANNKPVEGWREKMDQLKAEGRAV